MTSLWQLLKITLRQAGCLLNDLNPNIESLFANPPESANLLMTYSKLHNTGEIGNIGAVNTVTIKLG